MPRVSRIEMCMFCEQVPCICNKPAPKARKPRAVKADKPLPVGTDITTLKPGYAVPEASDPFPIERRRTGPFAGFKSPTAQLQAMQTTTIHEATEAYVAETDPTPAPKTPTQLEAEAISVLMNAGMLHPDEVVRFKRNLVTTRNPALDTRVNNWKKARRG